MEYPICAIRRPLENETTSQFRERRYELYRVLRRPLDDKAKAEIETEINHLIMDHKLIIDD